VDVELQQLKRIIITEVVWIYHVQVQARHRVDAFLSLKLYRQHCRAFANNMQDRVSVPYFLLVPLHGISVSHT
jgi:hypothetical protein